MAVSLAPSWFLLSVEEAKLRGAYVDPAAGKVNVGEWAERWYKTTAGLKPSTRHIYRQLLDYQILPAFERATLAGIDTLLVREWLAAQVEQLASVIAPPFGLSVRFDAYTGLRAGELAALRVGRLDLLRGACEVVESATDWATSRWPSPWTATGICSRRSWTTWPTASTGCTQKLLCTQRVPTPRWPPSGKAKGLVGDQALGGGGGETRTPLSHDSRRPAARCADGRFQPLTCVISKFNQCELGRVREGWFQHGCGPSVAPPWPRAPPRVPCPPT
jgi:hypothetical protein